MDTVVYRKGISIYSFLSTCFSFVVPINLPPFAMLTMAQPRAASLPFVMIRQVEVLVIFVLLATHTNSGSKQNVGRFQAADFSYNDQADLWTEHCWAAGELLGCGSADGLVAGTVRSSTQMIVHAACLSLWWLSLVCVRSCVALTMLRTVACLVLCTVPIL